VPRNRDDLERLPGVGRKTANVVLNIAFGEPTIAVDTHIFRVGNRTGLAPGKTPLHVEEKLEKVTPAEFKRHAHHWLILHGRYICKARTPECWRCPVIDLCAFKPKTPAPGSDEAKRSKKMQNRKKAALKKSAAKKNPSCAPVGARFVFLVSLCLGSEARFLLPVSPPTVYFRFQAPLNTFPL
jgi:endonuclease-3